MHWVPNIRPLDIQHMPQIVHGILAHIAITIKIMRTTMDIAALGITTSAIAITAIISIAIATTAVANI